MRAMPGEAILEETREAAVSAAEALPSAKARGDRRRWARRMACVAVCSLVALAVVLLVAAPALAQASGDRTTGKGVSKPIVMMIVLASLSMAPFVLVMTTSFLKFSVVGSILRSAMGTQQIPPNQVLMGLSLILTIYVMSPVGRQIYRDTEDLFERSTKEGVFSDEGVEILKAAVKRGKKPYLDFLMKHTEPKERRLFLSLGERLNRGDDSYQADERDFLVLVGAFVTSELTEAFQIGFILFVPFIVVDMIVSNVLLAMGMQMLSPTIVSLPIKLLLFVLVDGWHMLMQGLVLGYV